MSAPTVTPAFAPSRRGTELVLTGFAVLVALAAYVSVGISTQNRIPTAVLGYGLALATLLGLAHLVVRRVAPYADPLSLPCAALVEV